MRDGPQAGLSAIEGFARVLADYHLLHAVRADLYRRLGKKREALDSYRRALELAKQEPERRFLERRIDELKN
jgi:RNA polymerase sigma-70 factor (ECF subfamily)